MSPLYFFYTVIGVCTNVVLVLLDPQFDHVFGLLQDVHGVIYGAVLQTHRVDGQQSVSGLQSARSTRHKSKRITTMNWELRAASPDSSPESY